MRRQTWKKGIGLLLALALSMEAPFPMPLSSGRVYAYTERQAVINASSLNVRSGPGTSYSRVSNLAKGTTVTVEQGQYRLCAGGLHTFSCKL